MNDQLILSIVIIGLLVFFISGKYRYDYVSLGALALLILFDIIKIENAFIGFSHPAVITVALVLLISKGLQDAGLSAVTGNIIGRFSPSETQFLFLIMFIAAILSSFINNIGAMALLLPITLSTCQKMGWHAGKFLMPLAFASILGGMNTLIGTPPNIIIAEFKESYTGEAFNFFDFSYVGLLVSFLSIIFIGLISSKLVAKRKLAKTNNLIDLDNFLFELVVPEGSKAIGLTFSSFIKKAGNETEILGLVNENGAVSKVGNNSKIRADQHLVMKVSPNHISSIQDRFGLNIAESSHDLKEELIDEIEVVITPGSRLVGRKQNYLMKLAYEELFLLGMWRKGARFRTRLSKQMFKIGDVLLLGVRNTDKEDVTAKINHLGLMPIRSREISTLPSRSRFLKAVIFFTTAILLAAFNVINVLTAFLLCVLGFVGIKILKSNLYRHIEWPIVIMLAAMIPIGQALESTGITALIATEVVSLAGDLHIFWILMIILIITMLITDVINNAATAVIMAPFSVNIALQLGQPLEPFLMVVAVGASCAFLTPIGHQCNTLVMGPGNYKFSDYWRLGLPLDILIVLASIPMILFVWL
ncbi:MAG: SLC13 family permease [Gammaproteobacteria bacterium]|nr:MAG: SLC13 family permease [Gammaproteobacteria bacterium]